jgi:hypothetical protein
MLWYIFYHDLIYFESGICGLKLLNKDVICKISKFETSDISQVFESIKMLMYWRAIKGSDKSEFI